ncbi:hypothetical protein DUNSADRAFT_7654 [Dunaliella salina]|uniref:Uncharacterized protein n=1 Tax=Dunaliella salina TaxID=3046 RepID=A0ABQ7H656_DUNSA|nr:hypothetical protein DUNSADRAFT_7654 [Dunaliella salina]|eukprot:KAF5842340.1 hypothetical protein DUNSADRAFT_7654 [Dunaliella salina]
MQAVKTNNGPPPPNGLLDISTAGHQHCRSPPVPCQPCQCAQCCHACSREVRARHYWQQGLYCALVDNLMRQEQRHQKDC